LEDLNVQILQAFGVKARRIVKEKSYYICGTDKGGKIVRKSLEPESRVVFEHEVKEHLSASGFPYVDRFTLSQQGLPYAELDGALYVMTDAISAREADFGSNADFQKIIAAVAAMHRLAREIPLTGTSAPRSGDVLEIYRRQIAELDSVRKKISGARKRLSDFDVLFLKNHAHYAERMRASVSALEKTKLAEKRNSAKRNTAVCHNLLKEEYVSLGGEHTYITGFSQAAVDYQIFDLSAVLTRYAKNLPAEPVPLAALLELYDKHCTLDRDDLEILYPLLKYPGKFVKICGQYYSKNRTWTPNAIGNRIEGVLEGREKFEEWAKGT